MSRSTLDVSDRIRDLDTRRAWARARAPFWFAAGAVIMALFNAALVVVVLAAVARFWSWASGDGFADSPLWDLLGPGAAIMVGAAFVLSLFYLVVHLVSAAPKQVLAAVGAQPIRRGILDQFDNVIDGLAIGLGTEPPELWLIEDVAPNALSMRSRRRQVLAVTAGLTQFPRDELEAVCAHEMAHLNAVDAQWVTAAGSSVQRARRYANGIAALGVLLIVGAIGALSYADLFLPSPAAVGIALAGLGFAGAGLLGMASRRIRSEADDVADVAAVHLAKNPYALGQALDRMASNPQRVMRNNWRSELLWFETTEEMASHDAATRGDREVNRRAEAAYATARRDRPNETPPPS